MKKKFERVGADKLEQTIEAGVARASAARELSAEELAQVSGGASPTSLMVFKNPKWFGIWDWRFRLNVKPELVVGPDEKIEAGIAGGQIRF